MISIFHIILHVFECLIIFVCIADCGKLIGDYDALKKAVTINLTNGTPASSVVLEATTITSVLKLADVVLDTKQKNDDFHKALQDYTIYITISEVL